FAGSPDGHKTPFFPPAASPSGLSWPAVSPAPGRYKPVYAVTDRGSPPGPEHAARQTDLIHDKNAPESHHDPSPVGSSRHGTRYNGLSAPPLRLPAPPCVHWMHQCPACVHARHTHTPADNYCRGSYRFHQSNFPLPVTV